MGSEAHQSKRRGIRLLVDQHPVRLDVAVSMVAPVTAQRVVVVPGIRVTDRRPRPLGPARGGIE